MRILNLRSRHLVGQRLLTLLFFILIPVFAHSATYYVTKSGSDSNTCQQAQTKGTAKLRIAAGTACLAGGDTLIIGDGTYVEMIVDSVPSGSAGAPTVIKAENANRAILRPSSTAPDAHVVYIGNHNYITFDGLDADAINLTGGGGIYAYLVEIGTGHHIIFQNGTAQNAKTATYCAGIQLGGGDYNQILNMDIRNNGIPGSGNQSHGMYIATSNNIIDGNRISGSSGYAIHNYNGHGIAGNNTYRNNTITTSETRGVILTSGNDNLFYNNIVYGNAQGVELGASGQQVYNNTIYNNNHYCVNVSNGSGHIIRNNICYQNATDGILNQGGAITADHNVFGNPAFANAGTADFHLTSSSVAINAGMTISAVSSDLAGISRLSGNDAGAFEYMSAGATKPSPPINLRLVGLLP